MTAGIYVIRNLINGHEYVGKTTLFAARWKDHRSQLRRRIHPNPHLTYAWHHYGEAAFEFRVLEVVTDLTLLDERERHWGEQLQPCYNIEDFGANRISTVAPYRYSDDMATRVKLALDELITAGGVITPENIRRRASCSRNVVKMVLQDADWWTPELQRAARRSRAMPRVMQAYRGIVETGCTLTLSEVAREAGTTRRTAYRISRDEGIWTAEMAQEAVADSARQVWLHHSDELHQASARTLQRRAEGGFPNLQKGRATNRARGYPSLKRAGSKGRERLRELGYPNAKSSIDRQRREGFPALERGRQTQEATGWKVLRSTTIARNRATGEAYRVRIMEALQAGAAGELRSGVLSMSGLGKRLGMDHHTVVKHIRLLVRDGLLDASVLEHCHTGWHPCLIGRQEHELGSGRFAKVLDE